MGFCRKSPFDYTEIRIGIGNWESIVLNGYLLQILLSELLDVPTTLESYHFDVNVNLYQKNSNFDFWNAGVSDNYIGLGTAARVQDCRTVTRHNDTYEQCFHFSPEVWMSTISTEDRFAIPDLGMITDLGALSELAIFVPKVSFLVSSVLFCLQCTL